jgi:hypothetical protein
MKLLRGCCSLVLLAIAGLPVWGAVDVAQGVDYVRGAKPDDASCHWEAGMVSAAAASSQRGAAVQLSLQVADLKLSRGSKESTYSATVRSDVVRDGKLLATRDFQDEGSFKNGQPACDALLALGASLGKTAGEWASTTRFAECGSDCTGIHPDEPIAVGAQILIADPDALNDTVRNDCRWQTAMVSKLVSAFNDTDPPPRAKMEARAIEIEKYPGRRLVLRVSNLHALGGGGWSGPKWLDMSGELWDGGAKIANFDLHTRAGRGLTTCRSVESLSDSASELIVEWLQSPTLGAKLDRNGFFD